MDTESNRIAQYKETIGAVVASSKKGRKGSASVSLLKFASSTLIDEKVWTCQSPPRENTIKDRFSKLTTSWRPRRISVEVRQMEPLQSQVLYRQKFGIIKKSRLTKPNQGHQEIYFRMRKPRKSAYASLKAIDKKEQLDDDSSDDEEITSMRSISTSESTSNIDEVKKSWKTKFKANICDVQLNKGLFNEIVITSKSLHKTKGVEEQSRTLKFPSTKAADEFYEYFQKCQILETKTKKERFQTALGKIKLLPQSESRQLKILVDIMSARYLPIADFKSTDAYVVAMLGRREIHRTKYVEKSLNPVWTIDHKSVFVLDVSIRELFEQPDEGLVLIIKDYDFATGDNYVGLAVIPPSDLYIANGERINYKVQPLVTKKAVSIRSSSVGFLSQIAQHFSPSITLRFRHATEYDIDFLDACYNKRRASLLHESDDKRSAGNSTIRSVMSLNSKRTKQSQTFSDDSDGKKKKMKKYKVRPSPDPENPKTTAWMLENDLNRNAMMESKKWINFGQDENYKSLFGSLFVEVIKCDGLPNLDLGRAVGNKTDAFVTFVYGNNYGMSDVIDDKLSPRWPSWSRRAFIFHMMNPSQQLCVGVFDYDYESNHDFIGRVTVDLTNLRPRTIYTVDYSLKKSAMIEKHRVESFGTITLRIRIDLDEPRLLALRYLSWPEESFVNTKKKKHLKCIHNSIHGEFVVDSFSLSSIKVHLRQIQLALRSFKVYSKYAITHVLLWRTSMYLNIRFPCLPCLKKKNKNGYSPVERDETPQEEDTCWKRWSILCTIPIPFHSIVLCFTTFTLVENIWLLFPYFFLWLGIISISILNYRNGKSDPWKHCKTFEDVAENAFHGKSGSPHSIEARERVVDPNSIEEDPILRKMAEKEEKRKVKEEKLLEIEEKEERANEEFYEDVNLNTKLKSDINPLKQMFYPVQVLLFFICKWLQLVENIILWEESYISFIFTVLCFFVAGVLYIIPWEFIFYWTMRITVWILFGPWMKLLDVFFFKKIDQFSAEDSAILEAEADFIKRSLSRKGIDWLQARRERLMKMGAFKKYLYGKYMVKTPTFKPDRFKDIPLRSSMAKPVPTEEDMPYMEYLFNHSRAIINNEGTQYLMGEIIPKVQIKSNRNLR